MATCLVTGTSRGIGLELARQVHGRDDTVIATCRASTLALDAIGWRIVEGIDVGRDDVGARLGAALDVGEALDVASSVVVLHPGYARRRAGRMIASLDG